jgi:hypothetical protein
MLCGDFELQDMLLYEYLSMPRNRFSKSVPGQPGSRPRPDVMGACAQLPVA